MRPRLPILLLASCLAAAGCGTTTSAVSYAPSVPVQSAAARRPVVAVSDRVVNERQAGRDDPTWIGTIRGGYGEPAKRLAADVPVDRVVAKAFADGLAARGLLAPGGAGAAPYLLSVTIHQFDANQYARREATADFTAALTERATGREVWRDRGRAYKVEGSLVTLRSGVFGSTEELRGVAQRAMSEAVDALLDKPGFRAALRRG